MNITNARQSLTHMLVMAFMFVTNFHTLKPMTAAYFPLHYITGKNTTYHKCCYITQHELAPLSTYTASYVLSHPQADTDHRPQHGGTRDKTPLWFNQMSNTTNPPPSPSPSLSLFTQHPMHYHALEKLYLQLQLRDARMRDNIPYGMVCEHSR